MPKQNQNQKKKKPITVGIEEFKDGLNQVVTESGLPPFLLEMLLGEYLTGVHQVAQQEYMQDRSQWEESCKGE